MKILLKTERFLRKTVTLIALVFIFMGKGGRIQMSNKLLFITVGYHTKMLEGF